MKSLKQLLQDADPVRYEAVFAGQRDFCRQKVLATLTDTRGPAKVKPRPRIAVLATVCLTVMVACLLGAMSWSFFTHDLQATIRFEVRLAEDKPAPGLHAAKLPGSERVIYLYDEVVVSNGDIAEAKVIPGSGPSQFAVSIRFTASGAEKMRAATQTHIGKPMAILLDGQVAMAPVVKAAIGAAAVITGDFSKAQAERIALGVGVK